MGTGEEPPDPGHGRVVAVRPLEAVARARSGSRTRKRLGNSCPGVANVHLLALLQEDATKVRWAANLASDAVANARAAAVPKNTHYPAGTSFWTEQ